MKKHYLLLSAAMLLTVAAKAQGNELFFSEYCESSQQSGQLYNGIESKGQEKALEIFNPTLSIVNLNAYSIRRYSNGAALGSTGVEEERLMRTTGENTLARGGVFVISHADASIPAIVTNSNQRSAPRQASSAPNVIQTGGTVHFNGNDAMALVRYPSGTAGQPGVTAGIIVDVFGVIGQNPPNFTGGIDPEGNWRGTNPNDPLYPGTTIRPEVRSDNQSLRRRKDVESGSRSNAPTVYANGLYASGWNIADEWEAYSFAQAPGTMGQTVPPGKDQVYTDLGRHVYEGTNGAYLALTTLKEFNDGISLYPNPASGTATVEIRGVKVGRLTVLNALGQSISVQPRGLAAEKISLDVSKLRAGLYFVQCESADGQLKIYKELMVK